jgi:hypothetical protein
MVKVSILSSWLESWSSALNFERLQDNTIRRNFNWNRWGGGLAPPPRGGAQLQ